MKKELAEILSKSTFSVDKDEFVYARVNEVPQDKDIFAIVKDEIETTIVLKKEELADVEFKDQKDGYALIALNVSIPFYSVGFLAAVSNAIAAQEMNILIISTYSRDYILVKADKIKQATQVLKKLGMEEV